MENLKATLLRLAVFLTVCLLGTVALWAVFADLRFDEHTTETRDLRQEMLILHERVIDQFAALKGMDGPSWREFVASRDKDSA